MAQGWKRLLAGVLRHRSEGEYPIAAYSEFMPAPRLGFGVYGGSDPVLFREDDPWGWHVTEYEEAFELLPGLESLACQFTGALLHLGRGEPAHGIARNKLAGNPYWPPELAQAAGALAHERYVVLLPLALSRTQDDKGRVRWTLFGGSEQGPARAFWRGFFAAPGRELPASEGIGFFRQLLAAAYPETRGADADLLGAGFRIFSEGGSSLPAWTASYLWTRGRSLRAVRYLLTFEPFSRLPVAVRRAYLAGRLHLLPFPGSLLFWGTAGYRRLQAELPLAAQIPLLHLAARHEGPHGLRVPQSGWLHEPRAGHTPSAGHGPVRNTYIRTHRWTRVGRHEDELALLAREDKLARVLFSAEPDDVGLYGKPMARNVQIWTEDYRLLLDGPRAAREDIARALAAVVEGGMFGYRFQFPAMQIGRHEIYWHRPLVAYLSAGNGAPALLAESPLGFLTAYPERRAGSARPLELWPRLLRREPHLAAIELFRAEEGHRHTTLNVRKLLDGRELSGRPLPASLARRRLTLPKDEGLREWLDSLPARAADAERGGRLAAELVRSIDPLPKPGAAGPLTFPRSARRSFEVRYWRTIARLAEGRFVNKDNADCSHDPVTQSLLAHPGRDLEALSAYLLDYHARVLTAAGLQGKALAGEIPFRWQTDFDFDWSGGWTRNQQGRERERNLLVAFPGRDRGRAVIMADHYDTAYMEDVYEPERGGRGARLAAAGADDNHSGTAALMLAAPIFAELSRKGRLGCDVWLVHLTGEEFPSDCLGARDLCRRLVEGTLELRLPGGGRRDLSRVRVQGVFVLDMVAHNNDRERDVFQISPGTGTGSEWLAYQAHSANELWNAGTRTWNLRPGRRRRGRGKRSKDGRSVPAIARHPELRGEVRPPYDPRSTLYNTDGQIFSDIGVPVVLLMENYDVNRSGYHDSHDTMANIDLDYGAALVAIAIEAVARAASTKP